MLRANGHRVFYLSRGHRPGQCPPLPMGCNRKDGRLSRGGTEMAMVHLAGAGIADKRWTAGWKKEILESRVRSTRVAV